MIEKAFFGTKLVHLFFQKVRTATFLLTSIISDFDLLRSVAQDANFLRYWGQETQQSFPGSCLADRIIQTSGGAFFAPLFYPKLLWFRASFRNFSCLRASWGSLVKNRYLHWYSPVFLNINASSKRIKYHCRQHLLLRNMNFSIYKKLRVDG